MTTIEQGITRILKKFGANRITIDEIGWEDYFVDFTMEGFGSFCMSRRDDDVMIKQLMDQPYLSTVEYGSTAKWLEAVANGKVRDAEGSMK